MKKQVIKKINAFFIKVILIFFYIFIIGMGALLRRVFKRSLTKKDSYWINEKEKMRNIDYFRQPY